MVNKNKFDIKTLTKVSLFVALIAVFSQISIPMPHGIPLTMQVFAVMTAAFLLKRNIALVCITIYILLGIAGIPVFANFSSGIERLLGPTGGFIFGFYILIIGISYMHNRNNFVKKIIAISTLLIFHIIGVIQYSIVTNTTIIFSILTVSLPYILKDFISLILASYISRKIATSI